jgi:gas vesicle protein
MAQRRWYDKEPDVLLAIELMSKFPGEIQEIVTEAAVYLAEHDYEAKEAMTALRSLGAEKILPIFKSQNKMRSYDQNPSFHKLVNYMMVVSPENRRFLSKQILQLVQNISEYFTSCRDYSVDPSTNDISEATRVYVQQGSEDAKNFLKKLKEEFQSGVRQRVEAGPAHMKSLEDMDQGMKIRED